MGEEVNDNVVDEILKTATADSPESRLEKLEKEVDVLKGSIKRLLLDLRETLNNMENPFQNLQTLAEGLGYTSHTSPQVQQIQIVPSKPLEDQLEGEEEKNELENGSKGVEELRDMDLQKKTPQKAEVVKEKELSEVSSMTQEMEGEYLHEIPQTMLMKYDIERLFEIMGWVRGMLDKYSLESLKLMLEVFKSAGYIRNETVDFVSKVADLVVMNDNFEEMIFELYRLYKILYPEDKSIDSKFLNLILERKVAMWV